jgi:hypothetical protein
VAFVEQGLKVEEAVVAEEEEDKKMRCSFLSWFAE